MIFVEPAEVYGDRTALRPPRLSVQYSTVASATQPRVLHGPLRFVDGWDERILSYVSSQQQPVRIVSLASQLRKCVRHRDKQHKEKLKREILVRVGALIRAGTLARVGRKYVVASAE